MANHNIIVLLYNVQYNVQCTTLYYSEMLVYNLIILFS